jgi:integrase
MDLSQTVVKALHAHPAAGNRESDYVFLSRAGGPIDPSDLDRVFKRHLRAAGLPEIRFHDLRRTHATLLIAAGVHPKAIQARLGYASITTTLNTYGHLMPSAFQGIGEQLDAFLHADGQARRDEQAS